MKVIKIVLTGGPCAGKTKISEYLKKELTKEGYKIITVSETATDLIKQGFIPIGSYSHMMKFQNSVLNLQKYKEDLTEKFIKDLNEDDKVIIIYDRGMLDNRAYLPSQSDFDSLLKLNNLKEIDIANSYDLIIDLISTSYLDENIYKLDEIRYESKKDAKIIDKKTSDAWVLNSKIKIIKPKETIEEKQKEVLNIIKEYLKGIDIENKIVKEIDYNYSDFSKYNYDNSKLINIEDIYLKIKDNGIDYVLRKSEYNGGLLYELITEKNSLDSKIIIKREKITEDVYNKFIKKYEIIKRVGKNELRFIDNNYNVVSIYDNDGKNYVEVNSDSIIPENIKIKENPKKTLLKK